MPKLLINISQELYDRYMTCEKIGTNEPGYLCIPDETTDCIRNGMVIDENIIIDKEKVAEAINNLEMYDVDDEGTATLSTWWYNIGVDMENSFALVIRLLRKIIEVSNLEIEEKDIEPDSEETHTGVIGYKAFDQDLTGYNNFQYIIGGEYKMDESPIPCKRGYHFVKNLSECYLYYPNIFSTRICKIEALGEITSDDGIKFCTNHIRILEEIENPRAASNVSNCYNAGYCNSGDFNAGDSNCGNFNSGNENSGVKNTGHENAGDRNSGSYNIGDFNTGSGNYGDSNCGFYNCGNYNTGSYNLGNYNTGDFNFTSHSTGVFNTIPEISSQAKIKMFNKPSNMTLGDWYGSRALKILHNCPYSHSKFIQSKCMSKSEKANYPEYKILGGYIKRIECTTKDKQIWWNILARSDRQTIYELPNFDPGIFEQCTGIKVDKVELNNWRESLK